MTTGNVIRTALLLVAVSLPLFFAPHALAYEKTESDTTPTRLFDPKEQYNKIPDDVLLDRIDSKWIAQNTTDPKFEDKQNAVKMYAAYDIEKNGWNEAMKKTVLVTHNFDVLSGKAGNGFELVALTKSLDRMQGTYSATEAEKRFHDWVVDKYEVPSQARDIDARIDEIKDDLGPDLVSQAVAAFDERARHGNVPRDLIANDTAFWVITMSIAMCDYDSNCDSAYMKKVRDEKIYERATPDEVPTIGTSHVFIDYFLPKAYAAWVNAEHQTTTSVRVFSCGYESCFTSRSATTTGPYVISVETPNAVLSSGREVPGHASGTHVQEVYASSCHTRGNQNVYNIIQVRFSVANEEWSDHAGNYGCAVATTLNWPTGTSPGAAWRWSLTGTSSALIQTR